MVEVVVGICGGGGYFWLCWVFLVVACGGGYFWWRW